MACQLINKMNTWLKVLTCKHKEIKTQLSQPACVWWFSHDDSKVMYLCSTSYSAVWFHFSAAVSALDLNPGTQHAIGPI